jgi:hypothetical protein
MPETIEARLEKIVAAAYRVFAPYHLHPGTKLTVCYCNSCTTPEREAELRSTPLRSLTKELLSEYTKSAHDWDDDDVSREFRYFLPRYMELMAGGEAPYSNCLEFSRLGGVDWRTTWPADEVRVMEAFFDAILLRALQDIRLAQWPAGWFLKTDVSDVLTLIVLANGDLARALNVWDAAPDPHGAIHMAATRRHIGWIHGSQRHTSALLERYPVAALSIASFLQRPVVDQRLGKAHFMIDDPRLQKLTSGAAPV